MAVDYNERRRKKSAEYKRLGLCATCGGEKIDKTKSNCEKCREYKRVYGNKRRLLNPESYREADKRHREKQKILGLCKNCGCKLDREGAYCTSCLEVHNDKVRETRKWLKEKGFCPSCGKNKLFGDEKLCLDCKVKSAERKANIIKDDEYYANRREYANRLYYKRKEQGLCTSCGKPVSGYSKCPICRKKDNDRQKKRTLFKNNIDRRDRYKFGLCTTCSNKVEEGQKVCKKCHDRLVEMSKSPNCIANREKYKKIQNKIISSRRSD